MKLKPMLYLLLLATLFTGKSFAQVEDLLDSLEAKPEKQYVVMELWHFAIA